MTPVRIRAEPPIVGEPEPSPVAEPSPSVEPSPSPEVSPSPEPTVTPPTPAPEWTMSFASDLLGETSSFSRLSLEGSGARQARPSDSHRPSPDRLTGQGMRPLASTSSIGGGGRAKARVGMRSSGCSWTHRREGTSIKRQPHSPQSPLLRTGALSTGSQARTHSPRLRPPPKPACRTTGTSRSICLSGPTERPSIGPGWDSSSPPDSPSRRPRNPDTFSPFPQVDVKGARDVDSRAGRS